MVNRKQWRYLGSSDRTWRQLINDEVVTEIQQLGIAKRRHWSRWCEYEKSVCGQRSACWRDAADARVQLVFRSVVVVVGGGDEGGKRSIEVRPRRSVRRACYQMLSTAAVGPAAVGDRLHEHVAAGDRVPAVFTQDDQQRVQLALVGVRRGGRSLAGRTSASPARHFRLITAPECRHQVPCFPAFLPYVGLLFAICKTANSFFQDCQIQEEFQTIWESCTVKVTQWNIVLLVIQV